MIKINIKVGIDYTQNALRECAEKVLKMPLDKAELTILKQALVTSDKRDLHYKITLGIELDSDTESCLLKRRRVIFKADSTEYTIKKCSFSKRPIVVGSGPAGLFAALILAESGAMPIVLERGYDADRRVQAVEDFFKYRILDERSNIQFGEGGAGTFSDGKLKPGLHDRYKVKVLDEFVRAGAPEEIRYLANPHLGTDKLREIVKEIRKKIISLGGEVRFGTKVVGLHIDNGRVTGVQYEKEGKIFDIEADRVVLATGHSARDTFQMLADNGVTLEQKSFGIGVRIEHPQKLINRLIYGDISLADRLGAASYKLVTHLKNGRSVYSFCMCPGGTVVAAGSEQGGIVTNGMSEYSRAGENSNSAFLVSVNPSDFKSDYPLAGIDFQREVEGRAFSISGDYRAPVQLLGDFLNNRNSVGFGDVLPTYPCGTVFARAEEYLPGFAAESLRMAIMDFEEWMPGFLRPDAVLTGAETRSTSPVRIVRTASHQAVGFEGLYPCGEGAGYAGGIISSAVDGIKTAEHVMMETEA